MQKLIVMVGLSGSGKSSAAKELSKKENAVIISTDAIREELGDYEDQSRNEEVFQIFHKRIRENIKNGNNVIADATNLTIKSRRAVLSDIKGLDCVAVAYVMAKRYSDCVRDNQQRPHPVPVDVLKRQINSFQIPFPEEGFSCIEIDTMYGPDNKEQEIIEKMKGFGQKNHWHTDTLDIHCEKVCVRFVQKYPEYELGAKYHDCGKPYCQTIGEDGQAHYYGHANIGAYLLLTGFFHATAEDVFLVNYHMMPFDWKDTKIQEKYQKLFGEDKYNMLMHFHECDKCREPVREEQEERDI